MDKEKAEAYDKLLVKAKQIYNKENDVLIIHTLEDLFPELKESERIRKRLISYFRSQMEAYPKKDPEVLCTYNKWIAWLEKQGEQKPVDKIQLGKKYKCIASPRYSTFMTGKIYKPEDKFLCKLMNFCYDCFEPIEDDEQKVEPKFKVEKDKWYVCTSQYCNCIEGRNYKASLNGRIIDDYGTEYDMHSDAYKYFRLWTIQDAKDGDVLYMNNGLSTCTFIYKSIDNVIIQKYASYNKFGFEGTTYLVLNDGYVCPATKEQRDILFQKMKEAGYEWDSEKKELKKIE